MAFWHFGPSHQHLARKDAKRGGGGGIVREALFNCISQLVHVMKSVNYTVQVSKENINLVVPKTWIDKYRDDAAPIAGNVKFKILNDDKSYICPVDIMFDWVHEEKDKNCSRAKEQIWRIKYFSNNSSFIESYLSGYIVNIDGREVFRNVPKNHPLDGEYPRAFKEALELIKYNHSCIDSDTPKIIEEILSHGNYVIGEEYSFDKQVLKWH